MPYCYLRRTACALPLEGKMAGGAWDGSSETSELGAECCRAKKGVRRKREVPRGKKDPDH